MTTINNFDDILDILDRNPEYQDALRRRVLEEEHRRLPERIDRAIKAVEDLSQAVAEFVRKTNETLANHEGRLERSEGQIANLNAATNRVLETVADIQNRLTNVETDMAAMRGDMGDMRGEMNTMRGDMGDMRGEMNAMRGDMGDMRGEMNTMRGDMDTMRGDMDTMRGDMGSMERRMDSMQGQLNNLTGTDYERRIVRRSRGIVRRHFGIPQAQLLQAVSIPDNTTVTNLLYEAMESGVISHDQADDVDDADIILFGNTPDGSESYVLAEVSITIDDHDVDRAHQRATLLSAASGVQTKAAVIGTQISNANRERAASLDVAVVMASARVRA